MWPREFVTGFRKRKEERRKEGQKKVEERDRKRRLEERAAVSPPIPTLSTASSTLALQPQGRCSKSGIGAMDVMRRLAAARGFWCSPCSLCVGR